MPRTQDVAAKDGCKPHGWGFFFFEGWKSALGAAPPGAVTEGHALLLGQVPANGVPAGISSEADRARLPWRVLPPRRDPL